MVGQMGRRGTRESGRKQIKFPLGNTMVAERKTEKNGKKGGRLGLLPAQNTGNPYTHIHTHILDSLLALACRYDATVIHDS